MNNRQSLDIEFEHESLSKNETEDSEEEDGGNDEDKSSNKNQEGCNEDSALEMASDNPFVKALKNEQ